MVVLEKLILYFFPRACIDFICSLSDCEELSEGYLQEMMRSGFSLKNNLSMRKFVRTLSAPEAN